MTRRRREDETECAVCLVVDDDQQPCADQTCTATVHRFCSTQCIECGEYSCPEHAVRHEGESYCSACYERTVCREAVAA